MEKNKLLELKETLEFQIKKHKLFGNIKAELIYQNKLNTIIVHLNKKAL